MNEDTAQEGLALVPVDEDRTCAPAALLALYDELPGEVVAVVEYERNAITRDVLDHLRNVRDALCWWTRYITETPIPQRSRWLVRGCGAITGR